MLLTASVSLKKNFKSQTSGLHVPGWNSDVKQAHSIARHNYLKWIDNGKPRTGNLYQQMSNSRKNFKSKLRACKNMSEQRRADALATALQTDKSTKLFMQKVKRTKKSSPLPISVDSATGTIDVADHWRSHYKSILNSTAQVDLTDNLFVQNAIVNSSSFYNFPNLLCTVDLIHILLYKLPFDSSAGADTITAEHLCYCDSSVCLYLSMFFNMCLYHNFAPLGCLDTITVPIVKNANGNLQDSSNYRPIALTSVIFNRGGVLEDVLGLEDVLEDRF